MEGLFAQWMGTASYVYAEQAAWAQAVKAARAIVQATDGDRAQHYDAKTLQQRLAAIIKDDFKDTSVKANADLFTLVGTAQQLNQNNQQAIDAMIAGQGWTDVHVPESVKQQFTQQRIQEWVKATNDLAQANVVSATDKPLVILQAYQQAYAQQNEVALRQMMAVPPSMLWRLPPNYKQQTIQTWVDKTNALLGPNHAPLVTAETAPATILKVYQQLSLEVGQQKDQAMGQIIGVPSSALIRIPDEVKQQAIQSWVDKTNALLSPNGMPLVTVKTDPVTLLGVYYQQLSLQVGQQEDQAVAQMMGVPSSVLFRIPDEVKQQAIQRWVDKTNALLGPNQPAQVTVNTDPATILKVYQQLSLQIGRQIALQAGQQNDLALSYIMDAPTSALYHIPDEYKRRAIQGLVDKTNTLAGQTVVNTENVPSVIWNTYVQVREDRGVSDAYTLLHGHPPQGDINAAQVKADLAAQINRDLGQVMYHGQEDAAALVAIYNQIQADKAAQQAHLKAISPPPRDPIANRYERILNSPYQAALNQDHDIQVFIDQQTALDKGLQPGEAIKAMIGNALQDVDGGTGYLQSLTSQWFGTNALAHTVTGLGQTLLGGLVRTSLRNNVSQTLGLDPAAIPTSWPVALLQNVNQAALADPQGTKNGLASLDKAIQILGLDQQWSHTVGGIDQAWFNTASDGHLSLNTGAIDQAAANAGWQLDYYKRYISLLNPTLNVNTLTNVPAAQALAAQAYTAADPDTQARAQRRMIADQGYQIVGKQVNALSKIDQAFGTPQSISDWAALSADKLALLAQPFPQRLNADGVFNSPVVHIEEEKTALRDKLILAGRPCPPNDASLFALQQMWAATPEADRQAARVGYARYLDQQMRAQGAGVAIGFSETAAGFLFPPLVPVFSFLHAGADALQGNVGGALFSASIGLLSSGALTYSAAVGRAAAAEAAVGTEAVQGMDMLNEANTIAQKAGVPSLFTPEVVTDWTTDLQTWKAAQQSGLVSQLTDTLKLSTPFTDQIEGTTAYLDGVYQPTLPSIIRDGLAQVSNRFVRQGLEVAFSKLDDATALAVWSKFMGDGALDTASLLPAMTNELGLATTTPLLLPTPLTDATALALVRPSADVAAQIAAGELIPFNPLIPFTPPAPVIAVPRVQPPVLVPVGTPPAISVPRSPIPIPTTTLPSGIVVPLGAVGLNGNLPVDMVDTPSENLPNETSGNQTPKPNLPDENVLPSQNSGITQPATPPQAGGDPQLPNKLAEIVANRPTVESLGLVVFQQKAQDYVNKIAALVSAEAVAMDSEAQIAVIQRVLKPIFGQEAEDAFRLMKKTNPGLFDSVTSLKDTWDAAAEQMLVTLRNPEMPFDAKASALDTTLNNLEAVFKDSSLSINHDAFDFANARQAIADYLTPENFGSSIVLNEAGNLVQSGQTIGTMAQLMRDVNTANNIYRSSGVGRELVIETSRQRPLNVLVFSRKPSLAAAPQNPPILPPLEPPIQGYIVDVGAGMSAYGLDVLSPSDRDAGLLVQTEYSPFHTDKYLRNPDRFWNAAVPRSDARSVSIIGDILQTGSDVLGQDSVGRMFLNNINAHYDKAAYDGLATQLFKEMKSGGQVEVQWTDAPEREGDPFGSRGHIEGPKLLDALNRLQDKFTNKSFDVNKDANPIRAYIYSIQPPTSSPDYQPKPGDPPSPKPEFRWIFTFK